VLSGFNARGLLVPDYSASMHAPCSIGDYFQLGMAQLERLLACTCIAEFCSYVVLQAICSLSIGWQTDPLYESALVCRPLEQAIRLGR